MSSLVSANSLKRRKISWVIGLAGIVAVMVGFVAYSPELYRIFCDVTGYGGGTQKVEQRPIKETTSHQHHSETNHAALPEVTVYFDANTDKRLPWRFVPEQRSVTVRVGEAKQVFYRAHNLSDRTIVGQATFNVTPFQTGSYFFKSECFCFSEQTLKPGEEARMPIVFYIEEEMLEDDEVKKIKDITLSYTFYRLKDLEDEGIVIDHSEHKGKSDMSDDHSEHDHSEHDSSEHDGSRHGEVDNLRETGEERQRSIESGEEQEFSPAGIRRS